MRRVKALQHTRMRVRALKLLNTVKSHMLKTVWKFVETYIIVLFTVLQHIFFLKTYNLGENFIRINIETTTPAF